MRNFDPSNWFWLADDGRVFSSTEKALVSERDEAYGSWQESGGVATVWPRDEDGLQTDTSLQEVLRPYGIWVDLFAYVADRRWRAEQRGTVWNGWPIHTDDRSQGKYLSELQAIALGVRVDGDPWKFADNVFRPVSNAEFPELAIAARDHVRTVFGIEAAVTAQIESGDITTTGQIDAAFQGAEP